MTPEQQKRAKVLLRATLDIMNKCDEGPFVENVFDMTAVWDGIECDGSCLRDDINILFDEINMNKP